MTADRLDAAAQTAENRAEFELNATRRHALLTNAALMREAADENARLRAAVSALTKVAAWECWPNWRATLANDDIAVMRYRLTLEERAAVAALDNEGDQ